MAQLCVSGALCTVCAVCFMHTVQCVHCSEKGSQRFNIWSDALHLSHKIPHGSTSKMHKNLKTWYRTRYHHLFCINITVVIFGGRGGLTGDGSTDRRAIIPTILCHTEHTIQNHTICIAIIPTPARDTAVLQKASFGVAHSSCSNAIQCSLCNDSKVKPSGPNHNAINQVFASHALHCKTCCWSSLVLMYEGVWNILSCWFCPAAQPWASEGLRGQGPPRSDFDSLQCSCFHYQYISSLG